MYGYIWNSWTASLSEPPTPWSGAYFYSDAERPKLAAACHRSEGAVHPPHAQVPRHPPDAQKYTPRLRVECF